MFVASEVSAMPKTRPAGEYCAGEVIADRYILERPLCQGGMGVVWVAHSRALDVDVALKLLPDLVAGADGVERMSREARAAARLGHPAIVRVIDFGLTPSSQPFMAMELLSGEDLHAVLDSQGRLSGTQATALLLPVMDGLAAAHQAGVVHRDIKPENIFIAKDALGRVQPKVLDFGIAKVECDRMSRLTESGTLLGTPEYLSPEQALGREDVDFRTDIWSVGVVLYELVTGVQPFAAKNYNALLRSIIQDEPKPTTTLGAADEPFWHIIERCLRKDPAKRWLSMRELGEALATWLFQQGVESDASSHSLRDAWLNGQSSPLMAQNEGPLAPDGRVDALLPRGSLAGVQLEREVALEAAQGGRASARTRPRRGAPQGRMHPVGVTALLILVGLVLASWIAAGSKAASFERSPRDPRVTQGATPVPRDDPRPLESIERPRDTEIEPHDDLPSSAPSIPEAPRGKQPGGHQRHPKPTKLAEVDPEFGF